ncbi:MAG: hypothetical protein M1831_004048 [Alyxoria varia]|nr:MAG: hypothetical protein M1831_004048 [Alyxoria varia]
MAAPFAYKKVLMVGATSGIGKALAQKMLDNGVSVVAVGRRQERLDELVKSHSSNSTAKASSYTFDISALSDIHTFASKVTSEHPDLDCIFLNSGIQRAFNWTKPETIDLKTVEEELNTNYTSYIYLTMAFLPHLQSLASQGNPASVVFTTSGLAIVPFVRCANYSASKAALHHWILCLRRQLDQSGSKVQVVELLPPAVQTELHDEKHQPDLKNGGEFGMPLGVFTDKAWEGLCNGGVEVPIGTSEPPFGPEGFETKRQMAFKGLNDAIKLGSV